MTVYPAAAVLLLIWLWASLRDADRGLTVALASLPFGMFATIEVSGLSVLAAHLLAALSIGVLWLRRLTGRVPGKGLNRSGLYLGLYALYALFSATVLVRLFAGDFLVFPMSFDQSGVAVSIFFNSTMKPLMPTNSNIAQAGYILLSTMFFFLVVNVAQRRGTRPVQSGLAWAAAINIVLGLLDLMALDDLLAVIRTADYTLNNEHTFLGMPRVIGGYAEASEFGPVAAALFGFFAMFYLTSRRPRDMVLALGNLVFAVLSFSTTAFAAVFVALALIALHVRSTLGPGMSRTFGHALVILVSMAFFALGAAMILTPLLDFTGSVMTDLFIEKSRSTSGLERGAWARAALEAFVQTGGLGAGAGSLRGNGLVSVLLGSVGLPGTLAFVAFLWACFGLAPRSVSPQASGLFSAARVAALTYLTARLFSATTPDPTLFLVATAALATMVPYRRSAPSTDPPTRMLATGG